ncbi:GspE/PulE family protein [Tateyamaria sp. SN3-11]|uniref:GspE/PulE family protein n=1 Tax=Tateyamaria sp. SN3-11 TaxID=3092147 RepID=UPI0039EADE5A
MAASRLPFAFARDHQVIVDAGSLYCGPDASITGMREARRRTGETLDVTRVSAEDFARQLSVNYNTSNEDAPGDQELTFSLEDGETPSKQARDLLENEADAPVIQLVNQVLRRAVQAGSSDLHVEPHEAGIRARMRVDGFLRTEFDRSDVPVRRVVSRLKVMAGLDIAETRLPQDGHIAVRMGGRAIDIRVSTLPGNHGERVVMRLLDRSEGLMPLDQLGLLPEQITQLEQLAARPNGIILATGPTGSGKTTSLYSLLKLANSEERNIVTVEDPVEYDLPGISQTQINAEIGMTFAAGLRATLRQDPDIILVGEIRDAETASTAAQAALTGHLVFSSLHANGSTAAITRLRDLGLDDYLISSTLRGVIAQRLLRRLCPDCRVPAAPNAQERALFTDLGMAVPDQVFTAGSGCVTCDHTGFNGRVGIFETATVSDEMRQAISEGKSEQALLDLAVTPRETLLGRALRAVEQGQTTIAETLRVVGDRV